MLIPKYTNVAIDDLWQAYDYIASDSPQSAHEIIERIRESINMLCLHPHLGRPGRVNGTREFVVSKTPFIVIYKQHKSELWILNILHTSRKYHSTGQYDKGHGNYTEERDELLKDITAEDIENELKTMQ